MKSIILFFLIIFVLAVSALAQEIGGSNCNLVLKGILLDEKTKNPLALAAIWIDTLNRGTITNDDGTFEIRGFCPGEFVIDIHYLGYKELQQTVMFTEDQPYTFFLEQESKVLDEITVLGVQEAKPIQPKVTLSASEMMRSSGTSLGESLQALTGVTMLQTGPTISKPVIHGLHSNRILILNNGIRQEGQQWGSEHAPEIDPFIATELSVIKGAESVRYGADAIGGVVLVEPAPLPEAQGLSGELNLVGISNNGMVVLSSWIEGGSARLKGLGWRLQGTLKKAGDAQAADYRLTNTGLEELNFSAATGFHNATWGADLFYSYFSTELGILRSAHVGNYENFITSIQTQKPRYEDPFSYDINNPKQKISHQLLKASIHRQFFDVGKISLTYGGQFNNRQEFDIRRGGRSDRPALLMELGTSTLDAVLEHDAIGKLNGEIGLQGMFQKNENDVVETGTRPLVPNYKNYSGGIYIIENIALDRLSLEAGLRYDFRTLQVVRRDRENEVKRYSGNFNNVSTTVGASYQFSDHFILQTTLATAWRPPNINELFSEGVHHAIGRIEEGLIIKAEPNQLGINDFDTEQALKWINTLTYETGPLSVEASVYYNYIRNFIYLRPTNTRLTIRGFFPVFQYEQTAAEFHGLDLRAKYNLTSSIFYEGKASIVRANDKKKSDELIFIPADRFTHRLEYGFKKAGAFEDITISTTLTTVSKQRNAPPSLEDFYTIPEGRSFDFAPVPDAYQLVGFDAGATVAIGKQTINIGFEIANLFNVAYRDYMNNFRYYADDPGRNFILRLKYNFGGTR